MIRTLSASLSFKLKLAQCTLLLVAVVLVTAIPPYQHLQQSPSPLQQHSTSNKTDTSPLTPIEVSSSYPIPISDSPFSNQQQQQLADYKLLSHQLPPIQRTKQNVSFTSGLLTNYDDDLLDSFESTGRPFINHSYSTKQNYNLEPNNTSNPNPIISNHNLGSANSSSPSSANYVHPLLIYSMRYEIKSYDLAYSSSLRQSKQGLSSNSAPPSLFEHQQQSGKQSKTLIAGLKNTIGLDFYYSENESYIFWTDVIEERIYRGTIINGTITNVEIVVQTGLATAEGLAVDWIGKNIYWVESTLDHIEVANMNGSSRRTLIAGDMESPRAIAVDPRFGLLFWTDWDKKSPRIERATMSGDDRKTLVHIKEVNGGWPNGLTLDYEYLKIYWIDANSDSIHVVDYEGNNHQPLLKDIKSLGHPFSITLFENNLYWTDWKTNSVSMANKYNGSDHRELQRITNKLFDIKVFHPSRQPRIDDSLNPCYINNGNCSNLCLLSASNTRKCECPHLMKLSLDNQTCVIYERVLLIGRTNEIRAVDINQPLHHIMAPISVPKVFSPRQFEYDARSKSIFWVDSQTNEVKRAQIAGSSIDTIIDVIIESPSGLALDWISRNIYVTSASQQKAPGKIFISNLNGEYISILMDSSQGIISPKSIAVHPVLGLLFCSDENESFEPIIFSASMDGKNKRTIASKLNNPKLENPSNLAIDYESNRVYWINQPGNLSSIQYYDILEDRIVTTLDESETQIADRINPSVLCIDGDYLIISSRTPTETIMKISKHNLSERITLKTQNLDQLSALRVYNASSQDGTNACSLNNGDCSQLCVPVNSTHRTCKCTMGYSIDPHNDTECTGKDLFLIFSYNLGMKGISLEPNSSPDDYYLPPIHRAFRASSIDYVHKDNLIYWVDNEEGSITRINRDTTNYQVIVQGLESEESIGIDWIAGNIYWLDPYYDIIEVARLNGSNRYVIVSGDMDKANGIVVNPIKGYIVWSDIGSYPKIETAQLDGSNRRVIVNNSLSHIDDLAIDYAEDYIYWVDSTLALIERIKEDGTGRQIVYNSNPNQGIHNHLVSIAIYKEYLFVADSVQHQGSIIRCDKNTATKCGVIQEHLGDGIRDISVFAKQPIPSQEENPCVKNNGGCQDLCLFTGKRGDKRCICSHGELNLDGLTCKPYDTFVLFSRLSQIDSLHIKDDESFNNSPYPPIAVENRSSIISLTVDYNEQRVIYSEITREQICSVLFNGTDRRVLVKKQSLVEGIAFSNDQLYWTSIHDNSISRLNTTSLGEPKKTCDVSGCKIATVERIIKLTSEDKPRGIAIDSCTSYVYWTNWNANASIQRASPHNGYKVESIIKKDIKVPNGIAIDKSSRKLYWCDAKLDKIEICDLDGTNRVILISASPQHPFALAIWDNYVFWTDWLARAVFKADKHTGSGSVQIKKFIQRPMGIAVAAPESLECPVDHCTLNNGGCPTGYACMTHHSITGTTVECRPHAELLHDVLLPTIRCKYNKNGFCDYSNYHDIIMDSMDRYNLSVHELVPLSTATPAYIQNSNDNSTETTVTTGTIPKGSLAPRTFIDQSNYNPSSAILVQKNVTHLLDNYTTPLSTDFSTSSTLQLTKELSKETTTLINRKITTTSPPVLLINSTQHTIQTTTDLPSTKTIATSIGSYKTKTTFNTPITINVTISPPTQAPSVNTTAQPCQIVPAALHPTTDASSNIECKAPNQFKCYLSEKLVCISSERRCDGAYDCLNKEDENECLSTKLASHDLKHEHSWHKYVTIVFIVFTAAAVALFLVFGGRGRRRWFVGTNGAFNHRRMFDDNGTNIEISNPMFDEDDSGNLVHCAFSIDLNERTTNFSNPLYERQVLLINDKNVATN